MKKDPDDRPLSDFDLTAALSRFHGARVAVIGDLMLDRFVHGTVNRISPEAPIPILSVQTEEVAPGGSGNVVRNLASLGVSTSLVAQVGYDAAAGQLREVLADEPGVDLSLVETNSRPTSVKTRFIAGVQQLLRTDEEALGGFAGKDEGAVLEHVPEAIKAAGAVIISDYGKGLVSDAVIAAILSEAQSAGIPVLVDPKGSDFSKYRGASLLTPNRAELALASSMPVSTDAEIVDACRAIITQCGVKAILATRSEQGMSLVTAEHVFHIASEAREVYDVVGAGDTVVAVMAAGLAAGLPDRDAAWIANLAGGVVVAKSGTAVVYPDELVTADQETAWLKGERKVSTLKGAQDLVARWRKEGRSIGFTNGCFDLLHPGHIHLINQARSQCDRLIVGLNSDASVSGLKGPNRPVQNEDGRAAVLASLASVDAVVVFEEETPVNLIKGLRPDVLVKGKDYTVETVVGNELVGEWGGRVFLADLLDGHSTTNTVQRLKR